jgi:hypothetical protein
MVRPDMIGFDMPVLPTAFCSQVDMNSYLTDFHTPLDQAAKDNNETAIDHYERLKARFRELGGAQPGTPDFMAVDLEVKAYGLEAKRRYQIAAQVNELDAKIRTIPISPGAGCSREPWPQPVHLDPPPPSAAATGA